MTGELVKYESFSVHGLTFIPRNLSGAATAATSANMHFI